VKRYAPDNAPRPYLPHLPYVGLFAVLTVFFTWPLASILTSGVVGGAGDNLSFVWNFWWARTALATHQSVFWTPAIFAPFGTSLATHTFVPLLTVSAGWLLRSTPPLTLYNSALLAAVFLNFVCAYGAAFLVSRDRPASAFAGITFAASPFLLVRLAGHLNVVSAWGLPLALAMTIRHQRKPSPASAALLAAALGAVAYTDYYLFIFSTIVIVLAMVLSQWSVAIEARAPTPARSRVLAAILAVAGIVVVLVAWTAATGGTDTTIAGIRLRMTDTFNMRVTLGFLAIAAGLTWTWPKVRVALRANRPDPTAWRLLALAAAILAVLVAPILLSAARLWQSGDYSSQAYVWRNAPPGIDLASLFLGNQLHPLTGALTTRVYHHFGINPIEGAAWLGVVPIALAVLAILRLRGRADVQAALWIGGVFFVWSLGPYLRVLDYNTAVMLPQTLLRYVPIAANARIPGRAFVVVQLMVAIVGAAALSSLRETWPPLAPRAMLVAAVAIAGVLVDYWPATRAWAPIEAPPIYRALKDLPPGTLLNIPLGFRDGFGARGHLDDRVLFYQTVHEHPQMGGFVARLSKRVENAYDSDPIVSRILDLSEGLPAVPTQPGDTPCQSSLACSVKYIVVDKTLASGELIAFVADSFSLKRIDQSGASTLYAVTAVPACRCETSR
jgi:hypothetical protein